MPCTPAKSHGEIGSDDAEIESRQRKLRIVDFGECIGGRGLDLNDCRDRSRANGCVDLRGIPFAP